MLSNTEALLSGESILLQKFDSDFLPYQWSFDMFRLSLTDLELVAEIRIGATISMLWTTE